ncbi:ionotropic receptor 75a-like [Phymastichus coffea]|uniref:ionotropic receptor 75a-like n=1 Tax=Phymastichus coffea TaxID=108790 RepID=UPI00273B801C|nr:ionotropic receptor 75a-like [Phymastichus coffea]
MIEMKLVLDEATDYRIFDELRSWLILGDNLTEILSTVNDKAFGISTDFVIGVSSNIKRYEFYDVYNIFKERGGSLNVTYYGDWQTNTGLNVILTQSKFRRRSNLHRLVIKAMFYKSKFKAADMPLEEYYEDFEHRTRDGQSKFSFHVLSHLSDIYNFSLSPRESPTWEKGDRLGPIARALANRTVDVSGTPIGISHARMKFMKFVHQDWPFRTCFVFRNPQPTNIKVGEILRPLADEVWYLMGTFMPFSVAILLIAMRHDFAESDTWLISNSFLIVLGSLCQQCTDFKMVRISTRIAFFFIMIFSLLMFNYYSASVVSARLDEPIYKINNSLIQFGKLKMKMASEDMVYFEFFLKKPDWEATVFYENYWKPTVPDREWYLEPEIGIRLVKKGGFAYHTHPEIAYLLIEKLFDHREICELVEVDLGGPFFTSFAFNFNSTVIDIGRVGMIRIAETGLRFRQVYRWQYRKPQCRRNILSVESVTIYEFAPHLILLAIGAIFAMAVFTFEIYIIKRYEFFVRSRAIIHFMSHKQSEIADSFYERDNPRKVSFAL